MAITTEWKCPQNVSQDYRYRVINDGVCHQFYNLNNLKSNNMKYAYQSYYSKGKWHGGTRKGRESPIVYAYNYNFKIPEKAVIHYVEVQNVYRQGSRITSHLNNLKTQFLCLKTTASLSDYGGSSSDNSSHDTWKTKPDWSTVTTKIYNHTESVNRNDYQVSNITLTPTLINTSNFGQIIQVTANTTNWDDAQIAKMRMRVNYTIPETTEGSIDKTPDFTIKAYINARSLQTLSMDEQSEGTELVIEYTTKKQNGTYYGGKTPQVILSGDTEEYFFSNKKLTEYLVNPINVKTSKTAVTVYSKIEVYPKMANEDGYIICKYVNEKTGATHTLNVKLPVVAWVKDDVDFGTDSEEQACILLNNRFNNCWAKIGGSYYTRNTTNVAVHSNIHKNWRDKKQAQFIQCPMGCVHEKYDKTEQTYKYTCITPSDGIEKD